MMPDRAVWHYSETGSGRPLILLHGIGMSHAAWNAVVPYLAATRRVIAFDTAGFGRTPPLPDGTPPTIANLVDALEGSLRAIGINAPFDIAGNSLGGTMALEAARRRLARTAVAISPPGLWRTREGTHVKYTFKTLRFLVTRVPVFVRALVTPPLVREAAFALPVSVGSRRMPLDDALGIVDDLAAAAAFEETFESTRAPLRAEDITVPVTVAFGRRDWILTKGSRHRDRLPAHTRWIEKAGWGHVPMWADPAGVARVILEGTRWFGADRATSRDVLPRLRVQRARGLGHALEHGRPPDFPGGRVGDAGPFTGPAPS